MTDASKGLTREALYQLVWETPMSRLAAQLGISDVGLAKTCKRLHVPYPPRGWWAKKAAGKPVKVDPLPPAPPGIASKVVISKTPENDGSLKSLIQAKQADLGKIDVPARLAKPHPLVAEWQEERRRSIEQSKRYNDGRFGSAYVVRDFTSTERRRLRILHALFAALERHGASIREDDRRHLIATICGEKIDFSIHEKSRQVTRPMTAEEKRWETWNKSGVKKELEPTGCFQFLINSWTDQPCRKSWLESERQSMEECLPEIAATMLAMGEVKAEQTRLRREEEARYAERQRQLALEQQRRQLDADRWSRFLDLAAEWRRVEVGRQFLGKIKQLDMPENTQIDGMALAEWVEWAEDHSHAADLMAAGPQKIFEMIAEVKIKN